MRKVLSLLLALVMIFGLCCSGAAFADGPKPAVLTPRESAEPAEAAEEAAEAAEEAAEDTVDEAYFAEWNDEAPALNTLVEYVEAVTDEASEDFIPVEDRIAVFDMDGTLYGELFPTYLEYYMLAWRILKDPSITPDAEMLALGRELRESVITQTFAGDLPIRHAIQAARAYAGLTPTEFAAFVTDILVRDVDGFEGMTYGTAFYQPMIEVVEYLQDKDFRVYVCSGSDRAICRTLLEGVIDVPYANIIGMDVGYEATSQGSTDGLDYVLSASDEVVRTDKLIIKNLKMNKVLQIIQDIGQKPVLSFGNSSGDISMHMYTIHNNPYRSAAFMLIADDEQRDYGNEKKVQALKESWEEYGFNVISMKNDFRTIYGDNVVKTGSFRWAEELEDDRSAWEDSPAWVGELDAARDAGQLFIVAGVGETTATISMHEKDENGVWKQILTTPGFIGRNGLGKEAEGDGKTPVGTFTFNAAFGIKADPGCAIEYHQVGPDDYWSGDQRKGFHYNEMVSIKDLPDLNASVSEHLADNKGHYDYCLNISYNEEGKPGLGSAIFLHCLRAERPFTAGCVAIPREQMLTVMQNVRPDCVVLIDSLENISPELWTDWGLGGEAGPQIDCGQSALYTEEELAEAVALIREEFDKWEGCEMHSIRYAGDDCCSEENIKWLNFLSDKSEISECVEFLSDFHSPVEGGGAWNPDTEYTGWQWWLGREDGGDWELLSWGY